MSTKSNCELRRMIRHKLEDICFIATLVGGYDYQFHRHPWGKETIEFIEETESTILQKMEYKPEQHSI